MKVFGPSLDVARAAGLVAAVLASTIVYAGARVFGLQPRRAFLAAAFSVVLPPRSCSAPCPRPSSSRRLSPRLRFSPRRVKPGRSCGREERSSSRRSLATRPGPSPWSSRSRVRSALAVPARCPSGRGLALPRAFRYSARRSGFFMVGSRTEHGSTRSRAWPRTVTRSPACPRRRAMRIAYVFALFTGCPTVAIPLVVAGSSRREVERPGAPRSRVGSFPRSARFSSFRLSRNGCMAWRNAHASRRAHAARRLALRRGRGPSLRLGPCSASVSKPPFASRSWPRRSLRSGPSTAGLCLGPRSGWTGATKRRRARRSHV